jgi:hypothetical protein
MRLQDRDRSLLQCLYRFGVLSTRQIATQFFPQIAISTVLRRLRILEESRLITNCGHLRDGAKLWSLGKSGGLAISKEEVFRFANQNTFHHDVCVTEARFALENIGLGVDWTSEAELKRNLAYSQRDGLVPDGIFTADIFGEPKVIAFELELSAKSHLRYKNIFLEYGRMDAIGVIWYVVRNASITKPILKQWTTLKSKAQTILLTDYSDLIRNGPLAEITNDKGDVTSVEDVFRTTESSQGQSRFCGNGMSTQPSNESKSKQSDTSAPGFKMLVPSALDPSPSTCVPGVGVEAYGHNLNPGAEVLRGREG